MKWEEAIPIFKIRKIYRHASLDDAKMIPASIVELGRRWLKSPTKPPLYLNGSTGSGKTYFAIALVRELFLQGNPWIIFIRSDELEKELLAAILEGQERYVLEKYQEVPFLFIDDLGVERVNERVVSQYTLLIDSRMGDELSTVFTSNIPLSNMRDHLGDRISSRLQHCYDVKFPSHDLRRKMDLATL